MCPDGRVCPEGTVCRTVTLTQMCVTPDQIAACEGVMALDPCTLDGSVIARCYDGVCLDASCGNLRVDPGEVCDDGNSAIGDGCSSACKSDESCGNQIVDPVVLTSTSEALPNELCDDGNPISHDGCASDCQLELPAWQQLIVDVPSVRGEAGFAFDSARRRIVLFGGIAHVGGIHTMRNDTWEWDGAGWSLVPTATTPSPRGGHAMAYDASRRRIVMFGGKAALPVSAALGDTWEFDGSHWALISPTHAPAPRTGAAAVYDSKRHRIVLFGGLDSSGGALDETWEWDGNDWSELTGTPRPSPRTGPVMAFDPLRGVVVMAGGAPQVDTWELDGTSWRDVTPANASDRTDQLTFFSMAYDRVSERVITWGGSNASGNHLDTWGWNGTVWTKLLAAGSSNLQAWRNTPMMIGDPIAGEVILFGGWNRTPCGLSLCFGSFNDTWRWDGGTWKQVTPSTPGPRQEFGSARDTGRGALVFFGGFDENLTSLSETWELVGDHWTQLSAAATAPSVRSMPAMAYDAARGVTVLFGGKALGGGVVDDTWTWNGVQWTRVLLSGPPLPRSHATMAFDPVRGRIVMFGGADGTFVPYGDTWEWDGASWTELTPTTGPSPRFDAKAVFDPIRRRVVMTAGTDAGGGLRHDTWEWDGSTWSEILTSFAPPTRNGTAVAWNAPRRNIELFGGAPSSGAFDINDTWELAAGTWTQLVPNSLPPGRSQHTLIATSDGTGVLAFAGTTDTTTNAELWRLRWTGNERYELCTLDVDEDGDGLAGCADPDCWSACTPLCPPGATCEASWPHCGDGTCNAALEGCRLCPQDCGECPAVCGDTFCDPSETGASCPGDC